MHIFRLDYKQSLRVMEEVATVQNSDDSLMVDFDMTALSYHSNGVKALELKFPILLSNLITAHKQESYLEVIKDVKYEYVVVLIRSDFCALSYFEKDTMIHQKTIRAYMSRRKQGKNELTHSESGKKNKTSGGQIRYRNALRFFEEINETLNDWQKNKRIDLIFYSCPIKMWQYVFNSKVRCFFDKKDKRLVKIPLDVNVPNLEELTRVNKVITTGYLTIYHELGMHLLDNVMKENCANPILLKTKHEN